MLGNSTEAGPSRRKILRNRPYPEIFAGILALSWGLTLFTPFELLRNGWAGIAAAWMASGLSARRGRGLVLALLGGYLLWVYVAGQLPHAASLLSSRP